MTARLAAPRRRSFPQTLRGRAAARLFWAALLAAAFAAASPAAELQAADRETSSLEASLRRAREWLWSRQGRDGGWHSETYGMLRAGQALTPFVLLALTDRDHAPALHAAQVRSALDFIRARVDADGWLGLHEPGIAEYPTYATAYALRCLVRANEPADAPIRSRMRERLAAMQFQERNGYGREAAAHGGWGFGPMPQSSPGHMDLAHTRRVLEALHDAGGLDEPARERAAWFLALLQRLPQHPRRQPAPEPWPDAKRYGGAFDGGFYLSPVVYPANKGGVEPARDGLAPYFRSYATATCDGALALLALGAGQEDVRLKEARRWLERHTNYDLPDGVSIEVPDSYAPAIRYYHWAVRAEAHAALDLPGAWREALARALAACQRPDGSFLNTESHLMKEDDPLLCTALALVALNHCQRETARE
ncbi:MAG: terpene cyclase/mutase family protein [Planctomycetota bacterium]|nr:terpene cyclase/mutase family protein [Planctomycetota bacterium]